MRSFFFAALVVLAFANKQEELNQKLKKTNSALRQALKSLSAEKQVGLDVCKQCVKDWGGNDDAWQACFNHGECAGAFAVTSGEEYCQVDMSDMNCVTDGAGIYGNGEDCTIIAQTDGTISAEAGFSIERGHHSACGYDYLEINGVKYCGTNGPDAVQISTGDVITWHSDESVTNDGWTICLEENICEDALPDAYSSDCLTWTCPDWNDYCEDNWSDYSHCIDGDSTRLGKIRDHCQRTCGHRCGSD